MIEGAKIAEIEVSDEAIESCLSAQFAAGNVSLSDAVRTVARDLGVKKRNVYQVALRLKANSQNSFKGGNNTLQGGT